MAYYLVKAQYHKDLLAELRTRLDSGEINKMHPFGTALQYSLDHARLDPHGQGSFLPSFSISSLSPWMMRWPRFM